MPLRLLSFACALAVALVGLARAAEASRPTESTKLVHTMRAAVDRYRAVTWTYQRAAHAPKTPTTYSYRRSTDRSYLQWTVAAWQLHAYRARAQALTKIWRRLRVPLPQAPTLHASAARRVAYDRKLVHRLGSLYASHTSSSSRSLASARPAAAPKGRTLGFWEVRAASTTLSVALKTRDRLVTGPRWLTSAFLCIHHYEGAWTSNTGNGYYGGLQMDDVFMRRYGAQYLSLWGTADHWPAWAQLQASIRAYGAGRGFFPWPNTAAACGLL